MPQELPGFYYDKEKNRYFPLKGPIPGSTRSSSSTNNAQKPSATDTQASIFCRRTGVRISKLLQGRELNGNLITSNKGKCDFMEEFLKIQASQPVVWKYRTTEKIADSALEQIHIDIHTPEGQTEADVLITGGVNGSLSLFEVGKIGEHNHGVKCIPDRVWPVIEENRAECGKGPGCIWRPPGTSLQMSSAISCIKMCRKRSPFQRAFFYQSKSISGPRNLNVIRYRDLPGIATLGSETSGGCVYILNVVEPVDFSSSSAIGGMMRKTASFSCTIWTADCNPNSSRAVIGTNLGASLVNLETGMASWVFRSKSDVLSQQLDPSGNVVLCGLRNGAILTVDVREKQERVSDRLIRHRIPYSSLGRQGPSSSKQWFEVKGNIYPSHTIFMPSSICCLVSLQCYDQYFLASSMDGSIKLYDQRMTKRGAVQSYEGHVNSHTRLQLGVDQSERFVMAGGEDCNLRLWSIKSGKLLYEEKVSGTVLSTVGWRRSERLMKTLNEDKSYEECLSGQKLSWGTWFGSQEGLFYMY